MKKIIFYSYLKCSTCRKAAKWLDKKNFEYQLIDIVKEPPLLKYLNLDIDSLSREEIFQLFLSDGILIKRPFLVYEEKKVILGFSEIEYAKQFM